MESCKNNWSNLQRMSFKISLFQIMDWYRNKNMKNLSYKR